VGGIAVVLNDSSGSGDGAAAGKQLEEIFTAAGREVRVSMARGGDHLRAAVESAVKEGCETLVAGGGDGTINAAAAALVDRDITLGVIPLGTLNHFAKDLGIPLELDEAAKIVLEGAVCRVDVGEVNGRIFLNNSSLGVYPTIVRLRERYQAGGWGKWIAALWAGLAVLRRNPFMAVRIVAEGETIVRRTPLVFIGNNEYRMSGLQAGSRDSLVGGHLAVYVFKADRRSSLLRLGWQVLLKGPEEAKELDLLTVEDATVETKRAIVPVAFDGEVVSLKSPMIYRIRPASLRVLVPAGTSACYPGRVRPSSIG
jgi:diacylglycerol kinase family enzyme